MLVKEFIKILQKENQNAMLVLNDPEGEEDFLYELEVKDCQVLENVYVISSHTQVKNAILLGYFRS